MIEAKDDLAETRTRLALCRTEIEEIAVMEKAYFAAHSRTRIFKHWGVPQLILSYYTRIDAPIPIKIPREAGLVINEIRSCLEALVGKLAKRNGATSIRDVSFPIRRNRADFERDGPRAIRALSAEDQKKIVDIAPYGGGCDALVALAAIDNIRKHEDLMACGVNAGEMRQTSDLFSLGSMFVAGGQTIPTDGVEAMVARLIDCEGDMEFHPRLFFKGEAIVTEQPAVHILEWVINEVDRIVARFVHAPIDGPAAVGPALPGTEKAEEPSAARIG